MKTLWLAGRLLLSVWLTVVAIVAAVAACILFVSAAPDEWAWLELRGLGLAALVFGVFGSCFLAVTIWEVPDPPVWVRNLPARPNQLMAWWLKRRGWVAFYLQADARHCGTARPGQCWLGLYEQGEGRTPRCSDHISNAMTAKQYGVSHRLLCQHDATLSLRDRAAHLHATGDHDYAKLYEEEAARRSTAPTPAPAAMRPDSGCSINGWCEQADQHAGDCGHVAGSMPESQRVLE